jgi:hypothetical protein
MDPGLIHSGLIHSGLMHSELMHAGGMRSEASHLIAMRMLSSLVIYVSDVESSSGESPRVESIFTGDFPKAAAAFN